MFFTPFFFFFFSPLHVVFVNYCVQFQKTNLKNKIGWGLGGGSKGVGVCGVE